MSSTRDQILNKMTKSNIFFSDNSTSMDTSTSSRWNDKSTHSKIEKPIQTESFKSKLGRSNVHFGDDSHELFIIKRDKTSNKDYNPDLYYAEESAYQRKVKEYHPDTEKYTDLKGKTFSSSFGAFHKENNEQDTKLQKELGNPELSAKERKLLDVNSNLPREEVLRYMKDSEKDTANNYENECYPQTKDSKCKRIHSMKSNIFHDPEKQNLNVKPIENKIQEEVISLPKAKVTVPYNPWKANLDWKDTKNELIFKNEYDPISEDCSAFKRKVKDLQDHFDTPISVDKNFEPNCTDIVQEKISEDRQAIKNSLGEVYSDNLKLRKVMELSSVNQKDFYQNALKNMNVSDRPISSYEVKDIKDFENLKVKEIENLFAKKGIHIYDVKSSGAIASGNTKGSLEFKIRENNNDKDFIVNVDEVKETMKQMGLNVKPKTNTTTKKLSEVLPTNIKWHNTQVHNYIKTKKEELAKPDYNTTYNPEVEKISKNPAFNTSYKNVNGVYRYKKK